MENKLIKDEEPTEIKDEMYKEVFVNQNIKEPIPFIKEPIEHIPPNHPINLKEQLINPCHKENKDMLNHQNYMKEVKQEFSFGVKDQPPPVNHTINTVIKIEPRDEPIELTNTQQQREIYPQPIQNPPINIPTVIPMSQINQNPPRPEPYEEEKRPERPEITMPTIPPQIGQPPIQNLMQTGNLVTIGGNQSISHYGYLGSPYAQPSPKNLPHIPNAPITVATSQAVTMQNEPQNLKIKQESSEISNPEIPSSQAMNDPLQSLKDVKVPGFNLPNTSVSQPMGGSIVTSDNRPSSGIYLFFYRLPSI